MGGYLLSRVLPALVVLAVVARMLWRWDVPAAAVAVLGPLIAAPLVFALLFRSWAEALRALFALLSAGLVGWYTTSPCAPLANVLLALPAGIVALGVFDGGCALVRGIRGGYHAAAAEPRAAADGGRGPGF